MKPALFFLVLIVSLTVRAQSPESQSFFQNRLNRSLVIGEVAARSLDAVSTRQFMTNPCKCMTEKGSFYGMFSMEPIASGPQMYAYSLAMAGGQIELSRFLWNRGQHSRRRWAYRLLARTTLTYDAVNETIIGPIDNWRLIAKRGK